jgi:hypothetical protein
LTQTEAHTLKHGLGEHVAIRARRETEKDALGMRIIVRRPLAGDVWKE